MFMQALCENLLVDFSCDSINTVIITGHYITLKKKTSENRSLISYRNFSQQLTRNCNLLSNPEINRFKLFNVIYINMKLILRIVTCHI